MTDIALTAKDVQAAYDAFEDPELVQRTPMEFSRSLSDFSGGSVHLKMEHLQRTGSFKTRGAANKLRELTRSNPDIDRVVAASAGNHAQGVALAATRTGLDSTIVMPQTAPQAKIAATEGYGADVELHGTDFNAAMEHAHSLADEPDRAFVHAFNDPAIVAGQGTVGIEILEDIPDVETITVPIGGGGLAAGVGLLINARAPEVRLVGVQAATAATVPDSLQKGAPQSLAETNTIADGIATGSLSTLTLDLIDETYDRIITVTDQEIAHAILLLLERAKQLVEGAGAASVAALLSEELDVSDETVVPLLTGGNLDMSMLQMILTHELSSRSQLLQLRVLIDDQPGIMAELSDIMGEQGANIKTVHHYRADAALDVGEAFLVFLIETSGDEHATLIKNAIREAGYEVERMN